MGSKHCLASILTLTAIRSKTSNFKC